MAGGEDALGPPAMSRRRRGSGPDLDERLVALRAAIGAGEGVIPATELDRASALLGRAGDRLGHGVDHTVVALAGATGSGKSSLFNALAGEDLSRVGVTRPTTSTTHACWWGEDPAALLDWLQVPRRHGVGGAPDLDGLVLLDLPDHDSTVAAHRSEVDRVVAVADMVVWVLDPQKYADRAVHEGYLQPLAHHRGVLVVALHQADRLAPEALAACRADLAGLLATDGLDGVELVTTSVRQDDGVAPLRSVLAARVADRRAAVARLEADVDALAEALGAACPGRREGRLDPSRRRVVVDALVQAAGVPAVANAVAGSHRAHAVAATGWPATRWVRRLRPDPLRRLHLGDGGGSAARTSLPGPSAVTSARVETAVADFTDDVGRDLPMAWGDELRDVAEGHLEVLPARLDAAVAATDLGVEHRPRWWRAVGGLQIALAVVAVVGALWLAALAGLAYLQLSELASPDVGPVPLPTAMLVGGILAGLLVAFLARLAASVGAARRSRRAERRLRGAVEEVAGAEVFAPVAGVVDRHDRFCDALGVAVGG